MTGRPRRPPHIGEFGTGRCPHRVAGGGHPDRAMGCRLGRGRAGQVPAGRWRERGGARAVGFLGRRAPWFVVPVPYAVHPVPYVVRAVPYLVRPVPYVVRPVPYAVPAGCVAARGTRGVPGRGGRVRCGHGCRRRRTGGGHRRGRGGTCEGPEEGEEGEEHGDENRRHTRRTHEPPPVVPPFRARGGRGGAECTLCDRPSGKATEPPQRRWRKVTGVAQRAFEDWLVDRRIWLPPIAGGAP